MRFDDKSRRGHRLLTCISAVLLPHRFVGLVNVLNLKAGGLGSLGAEQLAWLAKDVAHLSSSTPIVLFAHVPLWTV